MSGMSERALKRQALFGERVGTQRHDRIEDGASRVRGPIAPQRLQQPRSVPHAPHIPTLTAAQPAKSDARPRLRSSRRAAHDPVRPSAVRGAARGMRRRAPDNRAQVAGDPSAHIDEDPIARGLSRRGKLGREHSTPGALRVVRARARPAAQIDERIELRSTRRSSFSSRLRYPIDAPPD